MVCAIYFSYVPFRLVCIIYFSWYVPFKLVSAIYFSYVPFQLVCMIYFSWYVPFVSVCMCHFSGLHCVWFFVMVWGVRSTYCSPVAHDLLEKRLSNLWGIGWNLEEFTEWSRKLTDRSTELTLYYSLTVKLLREFAELRKATVSFVMSVRLSIRPHGTSRISLNAFPWSLIFEYLSKMCLGNSSFFEIRQE
jgi:hypothetical protein